MLSLAGFLLFYTVLAVIDVFLLRKYIKLGPGTMPPDYAAHDSTRPIAAGLGS
jgi:cytochrome d ubiquinol oxidase subunit I